MQTFAMYFFPLYVSFLYFVIKADDVSSQDLGPVLVNKNPLGYMVLNPGDHLLLTCKSPTPVNWGYDVKPKNDVGKSEKFPTYDTLYPYGIKFELQNVTYMNTAYYICKTSDINKPIKRDYIYVFVRDTVEVMAHSFPSPFLILRKPGDQILIPCRPTSPEFNARLYFKNQDINVFRSNLVIYDPQEGFLLEDLTENDSGVYKCEISYGNSTRKRNYKLKIGDSGLNLFAAKINVIKGTIEKQGLYNISVARGMPFYLQCSLSLPPNISFKLNFKSPNDEAFQVNDVDQIESSKKSLFDKRVDGVFLRKKYSEFQARLKYNSITGRGRKEQVVVVYKNISSATNQDEGTYECFVVTNNYWAIRRKTSIHITVIDVTPPIVFNTNLNNSTLKVKANFHQELRCNVDGVPQPKITWLRDNEPLKASNRVKFTAGNQNVHLLNVSYDNKARYTCRARNPLGVVEKYVDIQLLENRTPLIVTIVCVVIVFCIVCVVLICLIRRIKREKRLRTALTESWIRSFEEGAISSINPELGVDQQAELLPYDPVWEFNRERLILGKQLGAGEFGVVMQAKAIGILDNENITTVAVKMVRQNAEATHVKALASELKIMSHLGKHLNVVNLLGACTKNLEKRELLVIVEYCKYGNLQRLLLRHRHVFVDQLVDDVIDGTSELKYINLLPIGNKPSVKHVNQSEVVSTCPEPTSASLSFSNSSYQWTSNLTENTYVSDHDQHVGYERMQTREISNSSSQVFDELETRTYCTQDLLCWAFQIARGMDYLASRKVLHGDLAARNVLLAEDNVVKICDFGLAKSVYKNQNYYKKENVPLPVKWMAIESIQDQVFSTQSDVWSFGIVLWELFSLAKTPYPGLEVNQAFIDTIISGYRMERPQYATQSMYDLMRRCWLDIPEERPLFSELVETLGNMLEHTVKEHYIDLNATYMLMNQLRDTDYLTMMSAPTYCSEIISKQHGQEHNMTTGDCQQPRVYLTMKGQNANDVFYSPQNIN